MTFGLSPNVPAAAGFDRFGSLPRECPLGQRQWLMSSVGRRTEHAGQTAITLTGLPVSFGLPRLTFRNRPADWA